MLKTSSFKATTDTQTAIFFTSIIVIFTEVSFLFFITKFIKSLRIFSNTITTFHKGTLFFR